MNHNGRNYIQLGSTIAGVIEAEKRSIYVETKRKHKTPNCYIVFVNSLVFNINNKYIQK